MEIICSGILAIIQFILFYGKTIGISMLLFVLIVNSTICFILHKKNLIKNKNGFLFLIPIILLSSTYLIFANKTFYIINIFAILILNIIMFIILVNKKYYLKDNFNVIFQLILDTILGYETGINHIKEKSSEQIKRNIKIDKENTKKVIKSIFIVLAISVIIIILLASADSIFADMFSGIENVFSNVNFENIFSVGLRVIVIAVVFFLFLNFIVNIQQECSKEEKEKTENTKNTFMVKVLLTVLNIIYLIFCYIQINSLFAKININETFNYANYARTGFFQLMIVSFINFAILLIADEHSKNNEKSIKILNLFLIIFTIIIAISSMYRMHMYVVEFGLTYLRFFIYVVLLTEMMAFIPITIHIFKDKFNFKKWCLGIVIVVYCGINYMNIESIIVERNINRKDSKIPIDYNYISKIATEDSYDILKEKINNGDANLVEISKIVPIMLNLSNSAEEMSWQEYNISKWKMKIRDIDKDIDKLKQLQNYFRSQENSIENQIIIQDKITTEKVDPKLIQSVDTNDIRYEKNINNNIKIRAIYRDSVLGQREIIIIGKTVDGGITWHNQLEMDDGGITVNVGAKFEFLDENIGFINNLQTVVNDDTQRGLLVTVDGGKKFTTAKFIAPEIVGEKYLYVDGIPYIENGILKVKTYFIDYTKNPATEYYEFYSEDKGLTWKYKE